MEEQNAIPRPNYFPALAVVGVLIAIQNLAIRADTTPDPFLRPALSVTQAFRLPPEMQPADIAVESFAPEVGPEQAFQEPDVHGHAYLTPPAPEPAPELAPATFEETGFDGWEDPPDLAEASAESDPMNEEIAPDLIAAVIDGAAGDAAAAPPPADPEAPAPVEAAPPPPPPEMAAPPPPVMKAPTPAISYTVKRGDTLYGIAKRFGIPLAKLKLANAHLPNIDRLRPGMELKLKTPDAFEHRVTAGESLWSIARFYGLTVGELLTANGLDSPRIFVNQKLEVPTAKFSAAQFEAAMRRRRDRGAGFMWPVFGRRTDHFGMRKHPILGRMIRHRGLDIAARKGTRIKAAQDGKVTFAGWLRGYGNLIEIRHKNGYSTRYGHCAKLLKKKGQRVHRGDVVAKVGKTGLATAPHVHFEIRKRGVPQDPMKFL